ncbi:MAG: enolase C-terminal domain-like protein [Dehalococcoidia bacterium]|nr:enolase C-terminal domain-like protein [Dehalococcoidia bacterium]
MKNKVQYSHYRIPLDKQIENSNYIYTFQDYIFIKVINKNKEQILEVSPLPKFSEEKIESIIKIFKDKDYKYRDDFPSLDYGISQLNQSFKKIDDIKTVMLLGNSNKLEEEINNYIKFGYKSFKIKFTKDDFKYKYKILDKLINNYKIRADFNNEFSILEAQRFLDKNRNIKFEFIEGLLKSKKIKNYLKINRHNQKISIDITNDNLNEIQEVIQNNCIDYVAIKPKLLGNYKKTKILIDILHKANIKSYISSSFETQIGFYKTITLAKYIDEIYKKKISHGLSTSKYLNNKINNGILFKKEKVSCEYKKINFDNLKNYQVTLWEDIKNKSLLEIIKNEK